MRLLVVVISLAVLGASGMSAQPVLNEGVTWVAPMAIYDAARGGARAMPPTDAAGDSLRPFLLWEAIGGNGDREALGMVSADTEPGGTVALLASFGVRVQRNLPDEPPLTSAVREHVGLREYFEMRFAGYDESGIVLEERRTDVDDDAAECFTRNAGANAHLVIGWHLGLVGCDDALEAAPWQQLRFPLDSRPNTQLSRGVGRSPLTLPLHLTVVDGRLRAVIDQ